LTKSGEFLEDGASGNVQKRACSHRI